MSDSPATTNPAAGGTPVKKAAKTKKPRPKPTHPRTSDMVNAAIKHLKERGGSSLQAIKKHIASSYKVDADKQASFIKKYLKSAVAKGTLVQSKGKGAAGSFKLPLSKAEAVKVAPKTAPVKKAPVKKILVKKAAPKKAGEKKKVTKRPAAKPPKAKIAAKKKALKVSPKKAKVTVKKVVKAKKPTGKKAAPKKK